MPTIAVDNYTDLQTTIQSYFFGRTDLPAAGLIALFEAKVNRKLFVRWMETYTTLTVNIDAATPQYLALPNNYQSMRRLRVTNGLPNSKATLDYVTAAQLDDLRDIDDTPRQPCKFTVLANDIEVYPTPDQAYTLALSFRQYITPLSQATGGVNWLLTLAPDLYLYGALMEAEPLLMNDDRLPTWKGLRDEAFDDLKKLNDESTYNAGPLIIRRNRRGY